MSELGPLEPLVGNWEGNVGLDVSYKYEDVNAIIETTYFEKARFTRIPVHHNGEQDLGVVNYEMTAWRHGEENDNPFHNENGYFIWDADNGQVMRCFAVPRGIAVLAGGDATATDRSLTFVATPGSGDYGFLQNRYLLGGGAKTTAFVSTFTFGDDGTLTYTSDLTLELRATGEAMNHTDTNTLHLVD